MNTEGYRLLKEFEGFAKVRAGSPNVAHAYPDPATGAGPWTIGYGFTAGVKPGDTMTRSDADHRLIEEAERYERKVRAACTRQPTENESAAMTCLAFNIGLEGFKRSTVLKAHNRGDSQAAARAFGLWNKAAGKEMKGLTRRRAAESALYLKPVAGEAPGTMPQAVDGESRLVRSPIVQGSTLTAGTATVAVAAETARSVRDIRDSLADWLPYVLLVVAIGGAAWVGYSRWKQRSQGWS